jgi:8-oxo-dGTP pyrophosphatase MutT (NUDIX family)
MKKKTKNISVVLGLTIRGFQVLLTRRNDSEIPDIHNMWEIPGGKPEIHESDSETAIREVYEETGYRVSPKGQQIPFLYTVERNLENVNLIVTVSCVLCSAKSLKPDSVNDHKIFETKWFDVKTLNFFNVIGGSRDFISWAAINIMGLKGEPRALERNPSYIILEKIGETTKVVGGNQKLEKNNKFYAIQQDFAAFEKEKNQYSMQFRWGTIEDDYHNLADLWAQKNGKKLVKKKVFDDDISANKVLQRTLDAKIRGGYYISQVTPNFPLTSWLIKHKDKFTGSKFRQKSFNYNGE